MVVTLFLNLCILDLIELKSLIQSDAKAAFYNFEQLKFFFEY